LAKPNSSFILSFVTIESFYCAYFIPVMIYIHHFMPTENRHMW